MPFKNGPVVLTSKSDATWELREGLRYEGRDQIFLIPKGFETDFASVPRVAVWLIPKFGRYTKAAILHDWLCVQLGDVREGCREASGEDVVAPATSRETDGLFRRVMREEGVPWIMRWLMWTGVRWGALVNPARRAGWWRDLPKVAAVSLLAIPIIVPAALAIGWGLGIYWLIELITGGKPETGVTT